VGRPVLAEIGRPGGVEVTARATGERSTRPIEEVEALLGDGALPS
jgi:hypothetical protein